MKSISTNALTTASKEGRDLPEVFLQPAILGGKPGIYFIGPFGRRVSFASQQRRALNTVWAVGKSGKLSGNPNVAVVGGGLAGLTTAAALIAAQCNVTLIEANDSLLERQDNTTHRYVHPTVNFWPEMPLNPTTELPYLDWFEDRCSDVISVIAAEWNEVFQKGLTDFLPRTRAVGLKTKEGEKPKVKLLRNHGHPNQFEEIKEFDLLFVTTGFGDELQLQPWEPSYWNVDRLEAARDAGTKKFVVGGTGDGGLIDALRVVQKTFDRGRICLKIVRELDSQGIGQRVKQIEKDVSELAKHNEDKAAKLYHQRYSDLLGQLSLAVREELGSRHAGVSVTLVGRLPHPYGLYVAPIHKLMIASALHAGSVNYVQGDLAADGDWYQIKGSGKGAASVKVSPDAKVVVRVGPVGPLSALLSKTEVKTLRDSQKQLADILEPGDIDTDFFRGYGKLPARNINDVAFVKFRKKLIEDYLFKNYRVSCQLSIKSGKPDVTLLSPDNNNIDSSTLPRTLFGIELHARPVSVGKGL
ncbi:FAD-dependent oxidoreductase [Rhizobium sp. L245/93]|uniref:FAD-dependent oxidoreductase n=1 Tax=Rhizobium sp. L245/93 TaxID=2819998 RepID=UPI001ADB02B5|nr:FAD-dependent oxidoreductase [Rhizobium sp. L245/93]MBO9170032.1 NAD-binding protein [Rhizobium sp. L245/93]